MILIGFSKHSQKKKRIFKSPNLFLDYETWGFCNLNLHTGKLFFRISKTRTHYTTRFNFWPMVLPTIWQLETFCQKLKFRETTSANLFFFKMGQTMPNYTSFLYVTLLQEIFVSACPTYIYRLYFIIIWLYCDCMSCIVGQRFYWPEKRVFFLRFSNFMEGMHCNGLM